MNLNESLYELNNLKEGLDGENCYYVTYVDPEGFSCQAVIKAIDSEEAEELLYDEYYSSGDDIEIESIEHIDEEAFDGLVADFRGSSFYDKLLKVINESREENSLNESLAPDIEKLIADIFAKNQGSKEDPSNVILDDYYDDYYGDGYDCYIVECDNSNPTYLTWLGDDLRNKLEPLGIGFDTESNGNGLYGRTYIFYKYDESLMENLHENKRSIKMKLNEGSNPMVKDEPIVKFWVCYDDTKIIFDLDTASKAYKRIIDILNSNPKFIKEYDLLDIGIIELNSDKDKNIVSGDWLLWCNPADTDGEDIEDDEDYLDTIIGGDWDWAVEELKKLLRW